ncbi:MAG: hypothetical protein M3Y72_08700, partial [Acidobacteriota bacterium]|nr:hypothetical protein [Acidobacteriota bacterium]
MIRIQRAGKTRRLGGKRVFLAASLLFANLSFATDRWKLDDPNGIVWNVATDARLPHADQVEMSGRQISVIVHYGVGADRLLEYKREIFWPTLRSNHTDVRGYLHFEPAAADEPVLRLEGRVMPPGPVQKIRFDGVLTIFFQPQHGILIARNIFPVPDAPAVIERWTVRNEQKRSIRLSVDPIFDDQTVNTTRGPAHVGVTLRPPVRGRLAPGEARSFAVITQAATFRHLSVNAKQAELR